MFDLYKKYETFTNKQKKIFDYMVEHPEEICYITLNALSKTLKVSEVSILRLCRTIGLNGFLELKEEFRKNGMKISQGRNMQTKILEGIDTSQKLDNDEILHLLCMNEEQNLSEQFSKLSSESLYTCARLLLQANEVVVFGHDASKIPADYLVHRLNYLRIKASAIKLEDDNTVKSILPRLGGKDCTIFFSFPPYHMPIRNVTNYMKYKGIHTITITDSMQSPAVVEGGYNFLCPTGAKFFFNSLTGPMALIGLLSSCIAVEMGDKLNQILEEEQSVAQFFANDKNEKEGENDD